MNLKFRIPNIVKKGFYFTLLSGDHEEQETEALMVALVDFDLLSTINKWKLKNTTIQKGLDTDRGLSFEGIDFLNYLEKINVAKIVPFFELHDDVMYNNETEEEVLQSRDCFR